MKKIVWILLMLLLLTACGQQSAPLEALPEGTRFSLTWGTYGTSSYDSGTGRLVKTTDATDPSAYVTTLVPDAALTEEMMALLSGIDVRGYPDIYDPINRPGAEQQVMSKPSQTLILTVETSEWRKTVTCRGIAYSSVGYDDAAQAFLDTCYALRDCLMATDAWKSLPEYEFFYA